MIAFFFNFLSSRSRSPESFSLLNLHFFCRYIFSCFFFSYTHALMTIKRNLLDRCQISYSFSLSIFIFVCSSSGLQTISENESFATPSYIHLADIDLFLLTRFIWLVWKTNYYRQTFWVIGNSGQFCRLTNSVERSNRTSTVYCQQIYLI